MKFHLVWLFELSESLTRALKLFLSLTIFVLSQDPEIKNTSDSGVLHKQDNHFVFKSSV